MRLNFSYCKPEVIDEGIRRLAEVANRALEAAPRAAVGAAR
jgi:DNA-binding transcriptional MocR family regulator